MNELLLLLGAAAFAFIGFGWLALGMQVHWVRVFPSRSHDDRRTRPLRVAGGVALAASFGACMGADHPSMAVLVWLMLLAGAAAAIAMLLSTRAPWLRWLWPVPG